MRKFVLLSFIIFISVVNSVAQNVGINNDGSAPHASAMLDVKHPNKGLLIPRVALTGTNDVATIASPSTSLLVYNTATANTAGVEVSPGFYYWNGSRWAKLLLNEGTNNVGIGTSNPTAKLEVIGTFKLTDGTQGANKVLSSDANGNATWATLNSLGGVSGTGTTNFIPKWTPNGSTLGNSLAFDNGTSYSIGSTTPTTDIFYVSNPAANTFATINQVGTNIGGLSFTRANAYKFDIAMNAVNDFYIQNYTSGSTALTILGANSNVGINQTNPAATLDVNGTLKLTDGTQGAGKVLTSDAAGNASWQAGAGSLTKFSSAWLPPSDPPSRDTSIDGTLTKVYYVLAPELTAGVIATGNISVYMRVGGIGPYELPYISNAGGNANAVQAHFMVGKIGITRPTFNEVAPNNINLPATLEFRYTIIQ